MRSALAITVAGLMLLSACGPKQAVEQAPAWTTATGKRQTQISMCEEFLDHGLLPQAFDMLEALAKDDINTPEVDYLRGRALYLTGQYSQAEKLLVNASTKLRKDARPLAVLGLLYADTDRVPEGINALRLATDYAPNEAKIWSNLGFLLLSHEDPSEAVAALENAVRLDGNERRYRNNLGFALAAAGRYDDALRTFATAGQPADALTNMGVAYELADELVLAREHYHAALEYHPKHAVASEALARLAAQESP